MHRNTASVTAIVVASARALSSVTAAASCSARDRTATTLLPAAVQGALRALEHGAAPGAWLAHGVALASFGLVDHLALRTRAIDDALEQALARGIDQVVILGAGLDTRPYRLDALRGATVFEVDHPDSQLQKRARAGALELRAAAVAYVSVDFARDSLSEQLQAHGHDVRRPTFWIWEGVVPYLELAAVRSTLRAVVERSALGSQIATTYVTPQLVWLRRVRPLIAFSMRVIGEPVRSQIERSEWTRLLVESGLEPCADTNTHDWRQRFGERDSRGAQIAYERLSLAERRTAPR
jgi:methyltransferase (TIGR00027 family)